MRYIYVIEKEDLPKLLKGEDLKLDSSSNGVTAFNIEINGELTNGDIIKAMFPNEKYEVIARTGFDIDGKIIHHKVVRVNGLLDYYVMDYEWWNAPYKQEM